MSIARGYFPAYNPGREFVPGVPLRSLSDGEWAALPAYLHDGVDGSAFYAEPPGVPSSLPLPPEPADGQPARHYDASANTQGGLVPGVPLTDLDTLQWAALADWQQAEVDGSPFYNLAAPRPSVGTPTDTAFNFGWTAVPGAGGYMVDLAEDEDFTAFVEGWEDEDVGDVLLAEFTALERETTYYARVRAYDDSRLSASSPTASVTTEGTS